MASTTELLDQYANIYQPSIDKLREKINSTDLVDHAVNTADSRFSRGVEAAEHINAASGGLTTRQQALARYNAKKAAGANRDASVNQARFDQGQLRENATNQLATVEANLLEQQIQEQQHKDDLALQRQLANEANKAANSRAKKGFWSGVAGTALGVGAAMLL